MEWHDGSCRRLDLVSCDGIDSCLRCGSFSGPATTLLFPQISKQSDIRLLYLSPGEFEQDIQCTISVHDISSRPEYEAISYTWADEDCNDDLCNTIFVSGQPLSVTRNCELALKRIRRSHSIRVVWIDAVCINQNDTNERGHQVRLMPQIYSTAQGVLIYIGEEADQSDLCLSALGSKTMPEFSEARYLTLGIMLERLLERRYFSRVWVLQEVALARTAMVICGHRKIGWTQLCNIELETPALQRVVQRSPVLKMKETALYTTPGRLIDLLDISRGCKANDPRDKVYAILGLVIDRDSRGLAADYSLCVKDLYVKVALHLALQHGWDNVFRRAGVEHRSIHTLPSWAPDWNHSIREAPALLPSKDSIHKQTILYDDKDDSLNLIAYLVGLIGNFQVCLLEKESTPYSIHNCDSRTSATRYFIWLELLSNQPSPTNPFEFVHVLHISHGKIIDRRVITSLRSIDRIYSNYGLWDVHYTAERLVLITAKEICQRLRSIQKQLESIGYGHRIGDPWIELMWTMEQARKENAVHLRYDVYRDIILKAIKHESRPWNKFELLWRNTLKPDSVRENMLRATGEDYELFVELNDAVWKLLSGAGAISEALRIVGQVHSAPAKSIDYSNYPSPTIPHIIISEV
ncbi:HET-domain-containing protein [Xylaria grammica]|nr:HET-domain-containing protein [Xylaria grammica]